MAGSMLAGCIGAPQNPAATQPATAIDPAVAQADHWIEQPAVASVTHGNFEQLWSAAEETARQYGYRLDRVDYRLGLLTTHPRISPQFFELWRKDIGTMGGTVQSSLATIRRTLRFVFSRDPQGGIITLKPKVLIERRAQPERRITSVVQYRAAIGPGAAGRGTREQDAGIDVPERPYWYAIGRDTELEEKLAEAVRKRLHRATTTAAAVPP